MNQFVTVFCSNKLFKLFELNSTYVRTTISRFVSEPNLNLTGFEVTGYESF